MAKNPDYPNRNFKIRVDFEQPPERDFPLIGFLFHCRGTLLQWQYVKDNILEFNLEKLPQQTRKLKINPEQLRLFIAPASNKNITRISSIKELQSYMAYEPMINIDANNGLNILPIPEVLSRFWIRCKCRVGGKISKWFRSGNSWQDRAVCKARVHICEIDPILYWINKIPDYIIAKIPDAILKPVFKYPIPIPDLGPFQRVERFSLDLQNQDNIFKTQSIAEIRKETISKLPELNPEIKQQLASGNLNMIRETLAKNYTLLHPWFCFWPWWWPYFYRCNELAVVDTNASGRFEKTIYYNCFGDKPDIYIWVEYFINGEWITVYRPPIPCNTHWNYSCGTDINIHITHPMVPGNCCCDCHSAGNIVFINSVGHTTVSHIQQSHQFLPPINQTEAFDRIGLTDAWANNDSFLSTTTDDYKRPFGGSPSLRMGFGTDLPNANMYYYRWSYRKISLTDLTPESAYEPLKPVGDQVRKSYRYIFTDLYGDYQLGTDSVKLGPISGEGLANENLYIIPPEQPEMEPFNKPESSDPHWVEETYNMNTLHFDSTGLKGDGLYQLKLELFDQAGNLLHNLPKNSFKTLKHDDANFSENAPNKFLENPTDDTADAFNMIMRIDNSMCEGNIYTVNVDGVAASPNCCGFVKYKSDGEEARLELSFMAKHPTNFAEFSFGVVKGSCGTVGIAGAKGMVIDSASGYNLNTSTGIYSRSFDPEELLGECYADGTGKGAFAETLHIITTATDGQTRIAKDYGRTIAFALEP
ncbi:hypothetical protein [Aequorivita sp. CIP111184]|uniref:hypothetical protein n=1 Tax=Aequorivita sp. CIP111184 TaxID=2211356 RepID=UPI000DBC1A35|nr:hypothetical protein [Aequorivita sp. CIP111184]SRX54797.1 hypothetical protein AEQU1_01815 [Aequorivita sp. CIP111184]